MDNIEELRKRVAELRGWKDILIKPSGEWIGTSPSGVAGKRVPDYTCDTKTAEKLRQVMIDGGYSVSIKVPLSPREMFHINIVTKGWGMPDPLPPGGKYEGETREIAICKGFVRWAVYQRNVKV